MKLFLITGEARHGKDTTASYIESYLKGYKISISDSLKKILGNKLGISIGKIDYHKNNHVLYKGLDIRSELRKTAKVFLQLDHHYFVTKVIEKIKQQNNDVVVIPDLRFKNEYFALKETFDDITIIRIIRETTNISDVIHLDKEIIGEDYIIKNNGTLEDLQIKIENIIKEIL